MHDAVAHKLTSMSTLISFCRCLKVFRQELITVMCTQKSHYMKQKQVPSKASSVGCGGCVGCVGCVGCECVTVCTIWLSVS